ncbi:hypothetical protein [Clostridium kluyveri]|uniref:hypothetical protein n=1 Tax=Clostridium kluyveri TaxID=1534 RepID=UPI002245DFB1|nr:hypothetical protein [Clostridium kluyveri]UZQ52245.1 hypothetical protein OP486_08845 [Clostridium kluyveri]
MSANEISNKAIELKSNSVELQADADKTRTDIRKTMDEALKKIKEVEKIKVLSDAILNSTLEYIVSFEIMLKVSTLYLRGLFFIL